MLLRFWGVLLLAFSSMVSGESLELTIASFSGKEKGKVTIELDEKRAPNHVRRIRILTFEGAYDGVVFHRVIDNFMAQTGDVKFGNINDLNLSRAGTGGSQYDDLKAEFSDIPFEPGIVGMARSRYIHSANSQFFIMTESHSGLNGAYTVIGNVTQGLDLVRAIQLGDRELNGAVNKPDYIKKAVILP